MSPSQHILIIQPWVFFLALQSCFPFFFVSFLRRRSITTPKLKRISWPWRVCGWIAFVVVEYLSEKKKDKSKELKRTIAIKIIMFKRKRKKSIKTKNLGSSFQLLLLLFSFVICIKHHYHGSFRSFQFFYVLFSSSSICILSSTDWAQ